MRFPVLSGTMKNLPTNKKIFTKCGPSTSQHSELWSDKALFFINYPGCGIHIISVYCGLSQYPLPQQMEQQQGGPIFASIIWRPREGLLLHLYFWPKEDEFLSLKVKPSKSKGLYPMTYWRPRLKLWIRTENPIVPGQRGSPRVVSTE
jgi:hypothetical protein